MIGEIYLNFSTDFCNDQMTEMFRNTFIKYGYECSKPIKVHSNENYRFFSISTQDENHSTKFLAVINTMLNCLPFSISLKYKLEKTSEFEFSETINVNNFLYGDIYLIFLYLKTLLAYDEVTHSVYSKEENSLFDLSDEIFDKDVVQEVESSIIDPVTKEKLMNMYNIMTYFRNKEVTNHE